MFYIICMYCCKKGVIQQFFYSEAGGGDNLPPLNTPLLSDIHYRIKEVS